MHTKVAIIGSGPAGYCAAIYTVRAGLSTIIFTGPQPGGQLTITTDVENYPGFAEAIQGPWLMEQMELQAKHVGSNIIQEMVTEINFDQRPMFIKTEADNIYYADSIIIATGAQAKWLDIPSEKKFQGFGVSGCATCDGFFYRGKKVIVVGGGNTAVEEAIYLTNHASNVLLIHRRDRLRAEQIAQTRLFNNPKIQVIWNTVIDEVMGTEDPLSVNAVRLKNVITGDYTIEQVDGVFIAIGHSPNTALFKDKLQMDDEGYLITEPDSTRTNIKGVFAAGDVKDKIFRQAVTAAGMGCMAALEAGKFLNEEF